MFRRAMKRAITNAMRLGAQGIKIMSAGRLNGIEIARTEWYREGRVPLHTMRAEIDYGVSEAKTSYGVIGIKVWVFRGEVMQKNEQPVIAPAVSAIAPTAPVPAPTPAAPAPQRPPPQPISRKSPAAHQRSPSSQEQEQRSRQPARRKYRKEQKGRNRGIATRGNKISFGDYGLKASTRGRLTARQIEAARRPCLAQKRGGRIWIRIFPDKPVSQKPAEVRMGNGKGNPEFWVSEIKPGAVLYEMDGVEEQEAREAFRLAAAKLPLRTLFVTRLLGG